MDSVVIARININVWSLSSYRWTWTSIVTIDLLCEQDYETNYNAYLIIGLVVEEQILVYK